MPGVFFSNVKYNWTSVYKNTRLYNLLTGIPTNHWSDMMLQDF